MSDPTDRPNTRAFPSVLPPELTRKLTEAQRVFEKMHRRFDVAQKLPALQRVFGAAVTAQSLSSKVEIKPLPDVYAPQRSLEVRLDFTGFAEALADVFHEENAALETEVEALRELLTTTLDTWARVGECSCSTDSVCTACASREELRGKAREL